MGSRLWMSGRSWMALPLVLLTGCAVVPPGQHVAVRPGPGKSFEQFRAEEQVCRSYAEQSAGMAPSQASNNAIAGSAVVGGLLGAAVGSAMGGRHSAAGAGAGFGVLAGTSVGVAQGAVSYTHLDVYKRQVGKRIGYGKESMAPHSLTLTMVGASLLWVGWFRFNAGSALEANGFAALAFINTFGATAAAVLAWCIGETLMRGKASMLGLSLIHI